MNVIPYLEIWYKNNCEKSAYAFTYSNKTKIPDNQGNKQSSFFSRTEDPGENSRIVF